MGSTDDKSSKLDFLCQYTTVRKVSVRDPKLALTYYGTILLVFVYVIVYTILINQGYQKFDDVVGTVGLKVKGTGSACRDNSVSDWTNPNCTVYDAIDLVYPSVELNALFITTSIAETPNQSQSVCDGNDDVQDCTNDTDCIENTFDPDSQGIYTGSCGDNGKCEVFGWCPLEDDSRVDYVNNVGAFTVFVNMNVRFPGLDKSRTNTIDRNGDGTPVYGLNLFSINQILQSSVNSDNKETNLTVKDIAVKGAVILADVAWNCNFDRDEDECEPDFAFYRLDSQDGSISSGFNFRTAIYDYDTDVTRTLRKLHGLRLVFTINGSGGQFNFGVLTITLGAGIAYLGIASLITDMVLGHCLKESQGYQKKQLERVRRSVVRVELAEQKNSNNERESAKWIDQDDVNGNNEENGDGGDGIPLEVEKQKIVKETSENEANEEQVNNETEKYQKSDTMNDLQTRMGLVTN